MEDDDKTQERQGNVRNCGLEGLMAKLGAIRKKALLQHSGLANGKYGKNELEDVRLPTYLELCLEAVQDPIMVMHLPVHSCSLCWRASLHKRPMPRGRNRRQEPFVILLCRHRRQRRAYDGLVERESVEGNEGGAQEDEQDERTVVALVALEVSEIVVGDPCDLTVGDIIPADGHFVQGNDMEVDESPLTGEPVPIKKSSVHDDEHKNLGSSRGRKLQGNRTFVAMAVGPTTVGKSTCKSSLKIEGDDEEEGDSVEKKADSEDGAAEAGDDDAGKSPLKRKLEGLAFGITKCWYYVGMVSGLFAFIVCYSEVRKWTSDDDHRGANGPWP